MNKQNELRFYEKNGNTFVYLLCVCIYLCVFLGDSVVDHRCLLTALTVFLLSAGPDVCIVEPLLSLSLQHFRASMEAKDPRVSE